MTTNKPKSNFVNFTAYNLRAEPVEGSTKASRFIFSSRNGWPRLTVFYGERNSNIYAPLDVATMLVLLDDIIKITDEPNGTKRAMTFKTVRRDIQDPTLDSVYEVSTLFYGKDQDGLIWLSLVDKTKDAPKIKFTFKFSDYIALMNDKGEIINDKAKLSQILAKARCAALKTIYIMNSVSVELSLDQQTAPDLAMATASSPSSIVDEDVNFDF